MRKFLIATECSDEKLSLHIKVKEAIALLKVLLSFEEPHPVKVKGKVIVMRVVSHNIFKNQVQMCSKKSFGYSSSITLHENCNDGQHKKL